jgi:hypothetical protein
VARSVAALAILVLGGCVTGPRDLTPALQGTWGGQHIGLSVGTLDTDVQFDCAEGTIMGPYLVEQDGSFSWNGRFTRGTGGPASLNSPDRPPSVEATYAGVVRGPEMTMTVELADHTIIGPFALERFTEPRLTRCL